MECISQILTAYTGNPQSLQLGNTTMTTKPTNRCFINYWSARSNLHWDEFVFYCLLLCKMQFLFSYRGVTAYYSARSNFHSHIVMFYCLLLCKKQFSVNGSLRYSLQNVSIHSFPKVQQTHIRIVIGQATLQELRTDDHGNNADLEIIQSGLLDQWV